jgi:valyl-tRNA synthetase
MLEGVQEVEEVNGVKICTRSGGVVQQIPKEQWFLNCEEMNADVMKALDEGVVSREHWYPAHWGTKRVHRFSSESTPNPVPARSGSG